MAKKKYTTVNGHEIVRDGVYKTRGGQKVTVMGFVEGNLSPIFGYHHDDTEAYTWYDKGEWVRQEKSLDDIMSPWIEEGEAINLHDRYIGWYEEDGGCIYKSARSFNCANKVRCDCCDGDDELIAITKADAMSCKRGEGL